MRTRKTTFILIAGKANVGKTTLADYLAVKLSEFKELGVLRTSLAAPIKRIATKEFGWSWEKNEKGRKLLQVLGTECGRMYDEDIWIRKTVEDVFSREIYPPNFVIIDDWRFPNEYSYIKDNPLYDIITIRVEAPIRESLKGTTEENHLSEISLPSANGLNVSNSPYDFVVDNNYNFEQLYRQGDKIVAHLEKDFILE